MMPCKCAEQSCDGVCVTGDNMRKALSYQYRIVDPTHKGNAKILFTSLCTCSHEKWHFFIHGLIAQSTAIVGAVKNVIDLLSYSFEIKVAISFYMRANQDATLFQGEKIFSVPDLNGVF